MGSRAAAQKSTGAQSTCLNCRKHSTSHRISTAGASLLPVSCQGLHRGVQELHRACLSQAVGSRSSPIHTPPSSTDDSLHCRWRSTSQPFSKGRQCSGQGPLTGQSVRNARPERGLMRSGVRRLLRASAPQETSWWSGCLLPGRPAMR